MNANRSVSLPVLANLLHRTAARGPGRARLAPLAGLAASALALVVAGPAAAATVDVQVEDNAFVLPAVAIKPGDSVKWTYPGTTENHNVHFDDGLFKAPNLPTSNWTRTRTFATEPEDTYLYHCDEHGTPGSGGMFGIVYVNASGTVPGEDPVASFTAPAAGGSVGQDTSFDAAGSTAPGSSIKRYEWDLDGNGTFETDTSGFSTVNTIYRSPGLRDVGLRVTTAQGRTDITSRSVTIKAAPTASFTAGPNPATTGQVVGFSAAGSTAEGSITRYEWDLDGNGSYETDTGTVPTTARAYATAGGRLVKLRVTDDVGTTAETTRTLQVNAAAAAPVTPTPKPAAREVSLKVRIRSSTRLRRILRRGLRFAAGVPVEGARLRATLRAKGRRLGSVYRRRVSRGRVRLTLRLSRREKLRLRRLFEGRRRVRAVLVVKSGGKTRRARFVIRR